MEEGKFHTYIERYNFIMNYMSVGIFSAVPLL